MLVTLGLGVPRTRQSRNAWLPTQIAGLIGWYDAADPAAINEVSGRASDWYDKSGHNNHLTTLLSGRPETGVDTINGQNVLGFSSDCFSLSGETSGSQLPAMDKTNCCIAYVFKQPANVDAAPIYIKSTASGDMLSPNFSNLDRLYVPGPGITGSLYASPSPAANGSTYSIVTNFSAATGIQSYVDNLIAIDDATGVAGNTFDRFTIGARPYNGAFWSGLIAEVCVFSQTLNESERLALHTYLAAKWGL